MANVESTRNRLLFAERRLNELKLLRDGHIEGAAGIERQPLIQEFFFHLVGSIDFLIQVVNQSRNLNIPEESVTKTTVCNALSTTDPIKPILLQLHPTVKNQPLQGDPYSIANSHRRVMLFRHKVCHCGDNPFHLRVGGDLPSCSLFIDPRDPNKGGSNQHIYDELDNFLRLVRDKIEAVFNILGV